MHEGWEELAAARRALDRRIETWAAALPAAWLVDILSYVSATDGKTRQLPRWMLVTHMFSHGTHHRGRLTTSMKQLGVDPGVTDLPWLPALYDGSLLAGREM